MFKGPIRVLQWGMTTQLGGLESFIMGLYRNMDRDLVQFDFLQAHNEGKLVNEEEIKSLGGRIYRVIYPQRESLIRSRTCLRDFFKEHSEYNIVHLNANFPYIFPLQAAKKAGVNTRILHAHNAPVSNPTSSLVLNCKTKIRNNFIKQQVYQSPTHYFACSDLAAHFMFPKADYKIINNGIDTEGFAFDAEIRKKTRMQLGLSDDCLVIGFCGNLRWQKNPLFTVQIFAKIHERVPKSVLLMIGDGILHPEVKLLVDEYNLTDSVLMLGQQKDVKPFYQAMDYFLLPSNFEGLGMVYIEAQCAGLPCLASADVVPSSAKVTDLLHFVSLSEGADAWANILLSLKRSVHREVYASRVREAGYDMRDVAFELQNFYLEHARKEE